MAANKSILAPLKLGVHPLPPAARLPGLPGCPLRELELGNTTGVPHAHQRYARRGAQVFPLLLLLRPPVLLPPFWLLLSPLLLLPLTALST